MEELGIMKEVGSYLDVLDWWYILSFTLMAYFLSNDKSITKWWKEGKSALANKVRSLMLSVPKGLRVLCLGLAYGVIFYVWGKSHDVGSSPFVLFQSFIFAVTLHGVLIKSIQKWFKSALNKNSTNTENEEGF